MPASNDPLSLFGVVIAAALTLMTLSYMIRDNALFRTALYLLIGVSAGYAAAIAVEDVLYPQLLEPLFAQLGGSPQIALLELSVRILLSLLLLTKLFPRIASIGNPATALMAGVGAALAIAGAVQGTLVPQIVAAGDSFNTSTLRLALQGGYYVEASAFLLQGAITLVATLGTLAYFQFGVKGDDAKSAKRTGLLEGLAWVGRVFIPIALASLFSGVLLASLTAFIERIDFLLKAFNLFGGG